MKTKAKLLSTAVGVVVLGLGTVACTSDSSSSSSESASPSASSPAATQSQDTQTIPAVAAEAGDFTTLVDALTAADLVETLSSGEYTVFAPTDAAFEPLVKDGTVEELLKDPSGQLTDILLYHVVEGKVTAADVAGMDGQSVKTVQGEDLKVKVSSGGEVTLTDASGNTVKVTKVDIEADNGVIHVIDGVLMPKG